MLPFRPRGKPALQCLAHAQIERHHI
jgi:hypothetical protein